MEAEVLRWPGQQGVIASGAFADVVVLDQDRLVDISKLAISGADFPHHHQRRQDL